MNRSDAKLKECVEGLLEEELKEIPKDFKIKETHVFSRTFEQDMKRLIQKNKIQKLHRMYKILGVCAVVALVIAVSEGQELFFPKEESASNYMYMEEITEEYGEESMEEIEGAEDNAAADGGTKEFAAEEEENFEIAEDYSEEEKQSWIKSSYGDEINVADMEEKPVGIKVSILEKGADGIILYQQIKNNTDKKIRYMEGSYMLEVWYNEEWYVISTSEDSVLYILDQGSRYANDIFVQDVTLYEGYQYRLLSMFNGELKASMFIME